MNKEELNRAIAEKLFGHKVEKTKDLICGTEYWIVEKSTLDGAERQIPFNYFYQSHRWEQVEDKLAELGMMVGLTVEKGSFEYDVINTDGGSCMFVYYSATAKTREAARYEALNAAWAEIEKRL